MKLLLQEHLKQLQEKRDSIAIDIFDITKFTIEEFISIFDSMDILMKNNDFEGCIKLSRSILENSINLQYIYQKDSNERSKNFKLTAVKGMIKKFESLNEYDSELKEINDFFKEELEGYKQTQIRQKFETVNSEDQYLKSYQRLSEFIHPTYRAKKIDFTEKRPFVDNLKRIVRSDTCVVTLMALKVICTKYDMDGGVMMIDEPEYKGDLFFATNPEKAEEYMRNHIFFS